MNFAAEFKNPWVKYSVFGIVGLGLVYIIYKHMGVTSAVAAQTSSSYVDPGLVALQQQQNAIQASASQAASNQSYSLTLDAQQSSEALAQATLAANTSTTQQQNQITGTIDLATLQTAEQTTLANINQQNIQASLASTATLQAQSLNATTTLAQINAGVQTTISNNNTNVALTQSNNNANVAIVQSNNNAGVATTMSGDQASTAQNGQDVAAVAGVAAIALMAFF